jgi:hypothetical protein
VGLGPASEGQLPARTQGAAVAVHANWLLRCGAPARSTFYAAGPGRICAGASGTLRCGCRSRTTPCSLVWTLAGTPRLHSVACPAPPRSGRPPPPWLASPPLRCRRTFYFSPTCTQTSMSPLHFCLHEISAGLFSSEPAASYSASNLPPSCQGAAPWRIPLRSRPPARATPLTRGVPHGRAGLCYLRRTLLARAPLPGGMASGGTQPPLDSMAVTPPPGKQPPAGAERRRFTPTIPARLPLDDSRVQPPSRLAPPRGVPRRAAPRAICAAGRTGSRFSERAGVSARAWARRACNRAPGRVSCYA